MSSLFFPSSFHSSDVKANYWSAVRCEGRGVTVGKKKLGYILFCFSLKSECFWSMFLSRWTMSPVLPLSFSNSNTACHWNVLTWEMIICFKSSSQDCVSSQEQSPWLFFFDSLDNRKAKNWKNKKYSCTCFCELAYSHVKPRAKVPAGRSCLGTSEGHPNEQSRPIWGQLSTRTQPHGVCSLRARKPIGGPRHILC